MKFRIESDFSSNLVVSAIHNGHHLRDEVRTNMALSESERLREEDPYTDFFTSGFANKIIVDTSRFEVDLNRNEEKCVYLKPEDAWNLQVRSEMPSKEAIKRSSKGFQSFYKSVETLLNELLNHHENLIFLDIHSFNHHRKGPDKPFDSLQMNPDIIIGTSILKGERLEIAEKLTKELGRESIDGRKIDCRMNIRFTGGNFPCWINKNFDQRITAISIEFKKTFMDEWSGEVYPEIQEQLKTILDDSIKKAELI